MTVRGNYGPYGEEERDCLCCLCWNSMLIIILLIEFKLKSQ